MVKADTKELREGTWNYFHLHASQRLITFNFYIVISTLLATGLFLTYSPDLFAPLLRVVIGLLLVALSFAFWKLDHRNRFLISLAENALRDYEESMKLSPETDGSPSRLAIFSREMHETQKHSLGNKSIWHAHLTYRHCFQIVFACFAAVGAIGFITGLVSLSVGQQ